MMNKYTQKQLEILEVSTKYLSKHGIQAFSLRNIANEIGIKQPTLYGHFKSKEEILKGIFALYKSGVETYQRVLASVEDSKIEKIKSYYKKMCELIHYQTDYMNLVMLELYQYRKLFKDDLNFLLNNMSSILKYAKDDPAFKDDIDYDWLIYTVQGTLHILLKNKLTSTDYNVLLNADKYWESLEKLIKK